MKYLVAWIGLDRLQSVSQLHDFALAGGKTLGSYYALGQPKGWIILEIDDLAKFQADLLRWRGMVHCEVTPILSAEEASLSFFAVERRWQRLNANALARPAADHEPVSLGLAIVWRGHLDVDCPHADSEALGRGPSLLPLVAVAAGGRGAAEDVRVSFGTARPAGGPGVLAVRSRFSP